MYGQLVVWVAAVDPVPAGVIRRGPRQTVIAQRVPGGRERSESTQGDVRQLNIVAPETATMPPAKQNDGIMLGLMTY